MLCDVTYKGLKSDNGRDDLVIEAEKQRCGSKCGAGINEERVNWVAGGKRWAALVIGVLLMGRVLHGLLDSLDTVRICRRSRHDV